MTLSWLVEFTGLAMIYASLSTVFFLGVTYRLHLVDSWRAAPLLLVTFFFIFLTQHPFPTPDHLECPVPSAEPQLHLLRFWDTVVALHQNRTGTMAWLSNKTIVATMMNFLVCIAIGAVLARHVIRTWIALTFGAILTLSVETTQLTGIWGLYPCAYRQFNVDDLLMNVLGILAGFVIVKAFRF